MSTNDETEGDGVNVFLCPACRKALSKVEHTIVQLRGRLSCETFSVTTLFTLSATLGTYGAVPSDDVELRPGAIVEFSCPHCGAVFTSGIDPRLAAIRMITPEGREMAVVFDRVCGEHSSFVIDVARGELVGRYGEHAALFDEELNKSLNFFGF